MSVSLHDVVRLTAHRPPPLLADNIRQSPLPALARLTLTGPAKSDRPARPAAPSTPSQRTVGQHGRDAGPPASPAATGLTCATASSRDCIAPVLARDRGKAHAGINE